MELNFKDLRPQPQYPKYPSPFLNTDEYLEQYFYNYYKENVLGKIELTHQYMPIWWTNLYVDGHKLPVQDYINALDWGKKWFTVCQMDDGVRYNLPPDTLVFHAGGNTGSGQKIPIPLLSSPIPNELKFSPPKERSEIFASFVGSMTDRIRTEVYKLYHNDKRFYFNLPKIWSQTVSEEDYKHFLDVMKRSVFSLCMAGYGDSSFRLYQSLEMGSIPVYISNRPHWLPFKDELNWTEFCVLFDEKDLPYIGDMLYFYPKERIQEMKQKGQEVLRSHFNLKSMCEKIIERLKVK